MARRGGKSARRGKRGRKRAAPARPQLTSHPTTRNAYAATREWLLKQYGPICAYCGTRHHASKMTLDHVAPRRGQTAYDRRDNLVLACQPCNQAKKDQAPLAFLLGMRSRAVNLVRYGAHLSTGLLDMARELVPGHLLPKHDRPHRARYDEGFDDGDSPYRD
ncbi:MAG TPA: HNH endonuclease signature motif containing protein [Gemmatimonadaceae bacterium]|nr:HNH endonuclease signature motif containing protein [Gemmatimonadaceae bacterium]